MNARAAFIHTHLFAPRRPRHCVNIYGVRPIEREFHCGAHGNRCRWHFLNTLSHPLSISSTVLSLLLFSFDQMERCSFPNLLVLRSESCDPVCYLILLCSLSLSLSIQRHPCSLIPSAPPLDKGRQRPFFSPWPACTLCVCTVPNWAPSLIVVLPSFCNRRCLGAPGPLPQACEGGPQRRGRVYYFI